MSITPQEIDPTISIPFSLEKNDLELKSSKKEILDVV